MRSQRHDPYPWTWEPAAATLSIITILGLIAAKAGTTMAAWIRGQPLPRDTDLVAALSALSQEPMPDRVVTIGAIIAVELAALITAGWGIRRLAHSAGAIGPRGFATPTEAQHALGPGRLHRHRRIIRPDLHQGRRPEALTYLPSLGAHDPSPWSNDEHPSHQKAPDPAQAGASRAAGPLHHTAR